MAAEGVEVATELLHVEAAMRHRLRTVEQHGDVALLRERDDLLDRVARADAVRNLHDRDQLRGDMID